jgi:hypothetical protein
MHRTCDSKEVDAPAFLTPLFNWQLLLNRLEAFEQKLKLPLPSSKPSSASGARQPAVASRSLKPAAEATSVQTDSKPRWRPSAKGGTRTCTPFSLLLDRIDTVAG